MLVRNAALVLVYFGAFHLRLYMQRAQGTAFKYNAKWPSTDSPTFLFRNQTLDNVFWTFASAVPIWTAWECLTLWLFANGRIPLVEFARNPVWFVALFFLVPLFREVHFYLVHRLIHWPPLYRTVHKLHHKNVNPGPWSGLAMHPVEHLLYFSVVLVHWVVPSSPVHALYTLVHAGLAPAPGHVGFDQVVVGDNSAFGTNCYDHYLHHKHFECNYSDGVIPIDKWFNTFHDGFGRERGTAAAAARGARSEAPRTRAQRRPPVSSPSSTSARAAPRLLRPQHLIMLAFLLQPLAFGNWLPRIPEIQARLGLSPAELALALLGMPIGLLATMPFAGPSVARIGARATVLLTLPAFLVAMACRPSRRTSRCCSPRWCCAGSSCRCSSSG